MLGTKSYFISELEAAGYEIVCPDVIQTLSEDELVELVPSCDGWIIGDDPATYAVFSAGVKGKLKAAVKWGVGTDNVDFQACDNLKIPVTNTPGMFGPEVADLALGYLIGLARGTYFIDRQIRAGHWPKVRGISISGKTVGIVGLGDIGRNVARRCLALDLEVTAYDPAFDKSPLRGVNVRTWPDDINACDFLIFTCALNKNNRHMLDFETLEELKTGVRIINVARGGLINEKSIIKGLDSGKIHSVAFDVFEDEPLPLESPLRDHDLCIFGSHNASNTIDAVLKTNDAAIRSMRELLENAR